MPNPKRRHSKTRTAKRRTHDALKAVGLERVPALPRAEAAAPRVRQLRLLPRPPGARGRRGVEARQIGHSRWPTRSPRACTWPDPNRMIWIAVDAMGGDDAPRHIVDGALAAVAALRSRASLLVGPADADRGRTRAARRTSIAARVRDRRCARASSRWRNRRRRRCAASRAASIKVAADAVARGEAAALVQRRAHRRDGDGGARRVRHAAGRRSAGAGGDDSDAAPSGDPARRRRQRRVPAAAPAAVRGDGQRVRARGARHRLAARRAAVDRRGSDARATS